MTTRTFKELATQTLSGNDNAIVFDNIPSGPGDLMLFGTARHSTTLQAMRISFNNDGVGFHPYMSIGSEGQGSFRNSEANLSGVIVTDFRSSDWGAFECQILNYASTTTQKPVLARSAVTSATVRYTSGAYTQTSSAVTKLTLFVPDGSNIGAGSTFTLYRVEA
jgi:hypothetical protein